MRGQVKNLPALYYIYYIMYREQKNKKFSDFFRKIVDFKTVFVYNHNYLHLKDNNIKFPNRKILSNDFNHQETRNCVILHKKAQYFVGQKKIKKFLKKSLKTLEKCLT